MGYNPIQKLVDRTFSWKEDYSQTCEDIKDVLSPRLAIPLTLVGMALGVITFGGINSYYLTQRTSRLSDKPTHLDMLMLSMDEGTLRLESRINPEINPDITRTLGFNKLRSDLGVSKTNLLKALRLYQRLRTEECNAERSGDKLAYAQAREHQETLLTYLGND